MLPAQIVAAIAVQVFPLAAEIDCAPLALRAGAAYKFRVTVESADGKKEWNDIGIGAAATLQDTIDIIFFHALRQLGVRQQGAVVTVTDLNGSPVRRVTFEFKDGGPKPIVRWVPRRK